MNDAERRAMSERIDHLARSWLANVVDVLTTLDEAAPGYPARTMALQGHGTNQIGDPTGDRAVNADPVSVSRTKLDAHLQVAHGALQYLDDMARQWCTVRQPRPRRGQTTQTCEVMALIGIKAPATVRTSLGGLLPRSYRLSDWVYRFARHHGRLPTKPECRTHVNDPRSKVARR